jgi:SnoaL-like domain
MMDDKTEIAHECAQLVYRAARFTDAADWEQLAALFAEDGRLSRPSDPANPIVGRANILASLRARPARTSRHLVTNILVDISSATTAHLSSTVTLITGLAPTGAGPVKANKILVGSFEDDVILSVSRWRFARRDGAMVLEFELQ